ncbi:hypothetical protein MMC20_002176 [Loxospora ochrophaea]|nr:hypothetical protein [Loxospora ochrophaea]
MERRTGESPMDFRWENMNGPMDPTSPFARSNVNMLRNQNGVPNHKRPFSVFDSTRQPSTPSFREPASQTYLFSQPQSIKPPPQMRTPSFTHFRNNIDTDFSSGAENPSSPENADNEDTPELRAKPSYSDMVRFEANSKSPSKSPSKCSSPTKQPPPFSDIFSKHTTPGRNEMPRRNYTDALTRRVYKRRRRDAERDRENRLVLRRGSSESDSEDPLSRPPSHDSPSSAPSIGRIPSFFTYLSTHPNLSAVLIGYIQLVLYLFLLLWFIYVIVIFWSSIRNDVNQKSEEAIADTLADMAKCARDYVENRCDREHRVPAMENVCESWATCMNRDPNVVGRAKISAHTFAEIFNGLVEPMSYKAIFVILAFVLTCFVMPNLYFWNKQRHSSHPPPPQHYPPPPPLQHPQAWYYPPPPPQQPPPQQQQIAAPFIDGGKKRVGWR